jgi:DNA-binding transcriptional regulator YiaG
LGIAQRTVRVKYLPNQGNQKRAKVLKLNIKTAGDWLKFKRIEKNLTLSHVAVKMGIATSLVCSWESSTRVPDIHQMKLLATILGFGVKDFEAHADNLVTAQYPSST